jgi:hypothetical protein
MRHSVAGWFEFRLLRWIGFAALASAPRLQTVRVGGRGVVFLLLSAVLPVGTCFCAQWSQLLKDVTVDAAVAWSDFRWGDWHLADGDIVIDGQWKAAQGDPYLLMRVPLREVNLSNAVEEGYIESIKGDLTFVVSLNGTIQSQAVQVLEIARIQYADFEAKALSLHFLLNPEGTLSVERLAFDYAGGRVQFEPFVWDPAAENVALSLGLEAIDMQVLTRLLPDWGFSAEGRMDGRINLQLSLERFDLLPGSMRYRADTNGRIRYQNEGWLTQGRAANSQTRALRAAEEAFGDLQLEQLNMIINGFDTTGPQAVLEIAGTGKSRELNTSVPVRMQINLSFAREDIESLPLFKALRDGFFH